jgi:hypothetical protein
VTILYGPTFFYWGSGTCVPTGDSLKLEFIFVVALGLGNKTRLTLCKIIGSYSPVSEDSGVNEFTLCMS